MTYRPTNYDITWTSWLVKHLRSKCIVRPTSACRSIRHADRIILNVRSSRYIANECQSTSANQISTSRCNANCVTQWLSCDLGGSFWQTALASSWSIIFQFSPVSLEWLHRNPATQFCSDKINDVATERWKIYEVRFSRLDTISECYIQHSPLRAMHSMHHTRARAKTYISARALLSSGKRVDNEELLGMHKFSAVK